MAGQQAKDADSRYLWFNPPDDKETSRHTLTRERVVAEALAVISTDGAQALSMRALARRLGVVPGALYRHVRSKEHLHDLILAALLAEADFRASPAARRLGDSAARRRLPPFLRPLPASSFPTLAAHGTHAWADDREERFTSGLDTLICGLQTAQRSPGASHTT